MIRIDRNVHPNYYNYSYGLIEDAALRILQSIRSAQRDN